LAALLFNNCEVLDCINFIQHILNVMALSAFSTPYIAQAVSRLNHHHYIVCGMCHLNIVKFW